MTTAAQPDSPLTLAQAAEKALALHGQTAERQRLERELAAQVERDRTYAISRQRLESDLRGVLGVDPATVTIHRRSSNLHGADMAYIEEDGLELTAGGIIDRPMLEVRVLSGLHASDRWFGTVRTLEEFGAAVEMARQEADQRARVLAEEPDPDDVYMTGSST